MGLGRSPAGTELQLNEDELIITKAELDQLHDDLYVLACAVDDVERDQAAAGKAASGRRARRHAVVAARGGSPDPRSGVAYPTPIILVMSGCPAFGD